jgi:hypothetical protein
LPAEHLTERQKTTNDIFSEKPICRTLSSLPEFSVKQTRRGNWQEPCSTLHFRCISAAENALTEAALADPKQSFEREDVHIRLIVESAEGDMVRDVPVSFDPRKRTFSGRRVMERGAADVSEQSDP